MRTVEADPRLSALLQGPRVQAMLDTICDQLVACQAALNQYIEDKRSTFPRLYFLSDDDLLELLGQARAGSAGRDQVIQSHLKKLFPGVSGARLGPQGQSVTALCSSGEEVLQLDRPVDIDCAVEIWLKNLENEMRSSLRNMTMKYIGENSSPDQDAFALPTQVLCLMQNIRFTEQVEKAISAKDLRKLKESIEQENNYYAAVEADDDCERLKRQALILQCAHYLAVLQTLIDSNVGSTGDWLWQKQLRFYAAPQGVVARMGLAQLAYSYEYLGAATGQFVRTAEADECFFVLTQSIHLGSVGNPIGPAGTGKTESVKALGALLGRLVLIFNCDEALDADCMGRLLSGVSLAGAWGCFDEFNRLSSATVSAVARMFATILPNVGGSTPVDVCGRQIVVSPWTGIMATLNPAGLDYGARRHMAGAVTRWLREVRVRTPRHVPIAAALLRSRRVAAAHELAVDLCTVYELAGQLLTSQRHYDWGLRALKACVLGCASALTSSAADAVVTSPRAKVRALLAQGNRAKLMKADAQRFEAILTLVFGEATDRDHSPDPLRAALGAAADQLGLQRNEYQIEKCVQLYNQMRQRMGAALVAPPATGKSTILLLLRTALTRMGHNIAVHSISPRAHSRTALLGAVTGSARQWVDGALSHAAARAASSDAWSWIVLDGDVDPGWVEALNSVLDDNRLLTLGSGARLLLAGDVNLLLETHSLRHASPATATRLNVLLLSEEDSACALDLTQSWISGAEFAHEAAARAVPLLQRAVARCVTWLACHKADLAVKITDVALVKLILTQFTELASNINSKWSPEQLVNEAVSRAFTGVVRDSAADSLHMQLPETVSTSPLPAPDWVTDQLFLSPRLAAVEPALRACVNHRQHVVVVGPEACGKDLLCDWVVRESGCVAVTLDVSPSLTSQHVISILEKHNLTRSGPSGGGGGGGGVLLLKSLHRASKDEWGTSEVQSLVLQLIQYRGFWNVRGEDSGWARCDVTVIMTSVTSLAERVASVPHCRIGEVDDEELLEIARHDMRQCTPKSVADTDIAELTTNMLAAYKELAATFSARHCRWSATHLRAWSRALRFYPRDCLEDLQLAVSAEAMTIFQHRLRSPADRAQCEAVLRARLRPGAGRLLPRARGAGLLLHVVDADTWTTSTMKLINQCLSENDNRVFGSGGAEPCHELAMLWPAMARACCGGLVTCVSAAGAGRRAAAELAALATGAALRAVPAPAAFASLRDQAVSAAGEGARSLLVLAPAACDAAVLAAVEALQRGLDDEVRQNLGIVICLDKDDKNIPEVFDQFPFLYTESQLIWIEDWCDATLQEMPRLMVQRLQKELGSTDAKRELSELPTQGFIDVYNSSAVTAPAQCRWRRAPARYAALVRTYYVVMMNKKQALMERRNMLSAGVEALNRARSSVSTLQESAAQQQAELNAAQAQATAALEQIAAEVRADTDRQTDMKAVQQSMEKENKLLQERKKEIEIELANVEPVVAQARAAVGDIRPEALSEIRSLRAPPDVVRDVLEGVLRLMGVRDTSWHSMKSFLARRGLKEDIRNMDASNISDEALASVASLVRQRAASFSPETARRASACVAPLAAWVLANLDHARVLRAVRPLQQQLTELRSNLNSAEHQLSSLSSGLATVHERVSALQEQLQENTRHAAGIELRLAAAHGTISAASELLGQLASEYDTWEMQLKQISCEISELHCRSLLAAAYLVFLPDCSEPEAQVHLTEWCSLLKFSSPTFSVLEFLCSADCRLAWSAARLPHGHSALKNALTVYQYATFGVGLPPVVIDPEGAAADWLRETFMSADTVSCHSDNLHAATQYATRSGRLLIITEVDVVHGSWWPLLEGHTAARVVLCARAPPSPHALLSPVYFTARADLHHQFIDYALQQENPEINEKAKNLIMEKAALQKQQYELQEKLLKALSTNSDLLHDAALLSSLNETRSTSVTIANSLATLAEVEQEIATSRSRFASSAAATARLALAALALRARHPKLVTCARAHCALYAMHTTKSKTINDAEVIKAFTRRLLERVLLSLRKEDKYVVVLHLLRVAYESEMPSDLWQFFIGNVELVEDHATASELKSYSWIRPESIQKLVQLKHTSPALFSRLSLSSAPLWRGFAGSGDTGALASLSLSPFEAVIVTMCVRPEGLYKAIVSLVDVILGTSVMSSGTGAGGAAVQLTAARAAAGLLPPPPVWLPPSVPLDAVSACVSAGRAGWDAALERCRAGRPLAILLGDEPCSPELTQFLLDYLQRPASDFSPEFRLWLVADECEVPPALAALSLQVVLEPPASIKAHALATLASLGGREPALAPTAAHELARLTLFHATAAVRRHYIPQGWTQHYAWDGREVAAWSAGAGRGAPSARSVYEARVARDADRRLLHVLLDTTVVRHLKTERLEDYASEFESLPSMDSHDTLHLPANCRAAWENKMADHILHGLRELSSTVSVDKEHDSSVSLKYLLSYWKKQMAGSDLLKPTFDADCCKCGGSCGWWCGAARAEARTARALVVSVHAHLARMRTEPQPLNEVPISWQKSWRCENASNVAEYLRELCARAKAAQDRLETDLTDDLFPTELDLRSLFHPRAALCALRARTAGLTRTHAHHLHAHAAWGEAAQTPGGVKISGVSLEGGVFKDGVIHASVAGDPPRAPAPTINLQYVATSVDSATVIPLYSDRRRSHSLLSLTAPRAAALSPAQLVLHAVALTVDNWQ